MKINYKSILGIDWVLLILPIIFVLLGISIIYSLTYYSSIKLFYNQVFFVVVGIVLMIFLAIMDYRYLKSISWFLYFLGIGFLILVLVFGKTSFGATRWIDLGFFDFQPSELFKIVTVIVLANYLSDKIGKIKLKHILFSLVIIFPPTFLVMMQPDLGTAIIFVLIALSSIFACKLSKKQILSFLIVILLMIPSGWMMLKDYQKQRVLTFINPSNDPYGSGYNVTQSLITVGSGGVWGRGFGHGPQSQLNFLPVAHTDFVFAGIAEATGYIGSTILIVLFALLLARIISLSRIFSDNFSSIYAIGIATIVFAQVVVNIGMNIGIMPVTGIPLPFISYGGSSIVVMLIAIGILQSMYLRNTKSRF
jgi:rod shape determining protein RodA